MNDGALEGESPRPSGHREVPARPTPDRSHWPAIGGEMGERIRAYDWACTPLGPIQAWPQSLRTLVDLMLASRQPACIAWGAECTSLYNDGYVPILGTKHPAALGKPYRTVWPEIWDEYRPVIAATMAGAISALANMAMFFGGRDENGNRTNPIAAIAVAILAPLAASLIQMAISRAREFEADRGGAEISGDPQALASALDKIHRYAQGIPFQAAEEHPATAQMMIMNPLAGGGIANLFSTHPATEERIARLMQMAQTGTYPA